MNFNGLFMTEKCFIALTIIQFTNEKDIVKVMQKIQINLLASIITIKLENSFFQSRFFYYFITYF